MIFKQPWNRTLFGSSFENNPIRGNFKSFSYEKNNKYRQTFIKLLLHVIILLLIATNVSNLAYLHVSINDCE